MSRSRKPLPIRKSASCQVYTHVGHLNSSSSDTSTSTSSSSENYDTPLRRFNRILRSSVARHWTYFKRTRPDLRLRGRSVSDTGLCGIVDSGPEVAYLDIQAVSPRRSLQTFGKESNGVPTLFITMSVTSLVRRSAGGSGSVGAEEASDGSDAERPRRGHHLRVPTPALTQSLNAFVRVILLIERVKCSQNVFKSMVRRELIEFLCYVIVQMEKNVQKTGVPRTVRWSLRRESLPLAQFRQAFLKGRRSISPDNFPWRRRSTGNFAAGAAGGGCGAPRSAPATPLQLEPHPRSTKHDNQLL
ncbi:hypothetical protein B5X24_HaOG214618 [Helicoverpa armigera]|nr:hypothetical protein B5X24_HaOG214618 [Helicoverpa armigera]